MAVQPPLAQLISLKGKRALITGSASGLGKAIAYRFAEAGADLLLADIAPVALARVKEEFSGFDVNVTTHVIDLSQKDQIDRLWTQLGAASPDILVNNAGIYPLRRFVEADETFHRRVMEINLFSVYWMCQHMIGQRRTQGGVILNIGSIEALLPFKKDLTHYSVAKAGVIALTRSLASEYARQGFRVNAIVPGGIVTPGTMATARQILRLRFGLLKTGYDFYARLPIGRPGQPDEVARMALALVSDLASYVHGAIIPVDGGFLSA